jgi:hypothetical protein
MEKEFVPYEEALALKELGFNEDCLGMFDEYKEFNCLGIPHNANILQGCISRPLYQQAFRWFRDKNYEVYYSKKEGNITFKIEYGHWDYISTKSFLDYEEAELECLKQLIKLVKNG